MSMYTIMPIEQVMQGIEDERQPWVEVKLGNKLLQLEAIAPGIGRIERVFSDSLDDYLDPAYQPGQVIAYGMASTNT